MRFSTKALRILILRRPLLLLGLIQRVHFLTHCSISIVNFKGKECNCSKTLIKQSLPYIKRNECTDKAKMAP